MHDGVILFAFENRKNPGFSKLNFPFSTKIQLFLHETHSYDLEWCFIMPWHVFSGSWLILLVPKWPWLIFIGFLQCMPFEWLKFTQNITKKIFDTFFRILHEKSFKMICYMTYFCYVCADLSIKLLKFQILTLKFSILFCINALIFWSVWFI